MRLSVRFPALLILAGLLAAACSGAGDSGPDEISAYVMCQDFVEDRLKAPSTADFPQLSDWTATKTGPDQWRIRSYVDAENSFGAAIRSRFVCEVRYVGNDRWRLIDLQFQE
jgi:hypothetical protein